VALDAQRTELGSRINDLKRNGSDFSHLLERELLQLKATLPVEYVRREDWIRFSNTLEAKIDAMRAEVRAEIADLRAEIADLRVEIADLRVEIADLRARMYQPGSRLAPAADITP